ncbi:potassium channel family protein [Subtercola sp. YIM 133946]|uniref:potassium channel family protein n=1 Tax=Subtercola sp. YIM 133946 TaxID=3118909 RepID=UPI002F936F16
MTSEREPHARMTQERWQTVTEWPLNIAALLFLVAYSVKVIANSQGFTLAFLYGVMIVVWVAFVINYVVNLAIAGPNRRQWVRKNWYQIPITLLPALEPLRLLRLVKLADLLPPTTEGGRLRGRVGLYVLSTLILVVYVGALGVLDAEQNAPGANILNLPDALWWAIVTVTTVGYGDFVPITAQGRLVAAALMLSGVALIGTITGTLASYLGERSRAHDANRTGASKKQVDDLAAQITALQAQLKARSDDEKRHDTGTGTATGTEMRPATADSGAATATGTGSGTGTGTDTGVSGAV